MLLHLHTAFFWLHVACGSLSLLLFWPPLWTRKGARDHRAWGRWFHRCMLLVAVSGLLMSLLVLADPLAIRDPQGLLDAAAAQRRAESARLSSLFLLFLSVLVISLLNHGMAVVQARERRSELRRWYRLAPVTGLLLLSLPLIGLGALHGSVLLLAFGGIGLANGIGTLRYVFKSRIGPREWWIEHLGSMIGAGIGAYTAFLAFGARSLLAGLMPNETALLLPWLAPSIVGSAAIVWQSRRYRARLGGSRAASVA